VSSGARSRVRACRPAAPFPDARLRPLFLLAGLAAAPATMADAGVAEAARLRNPAFTLLLPWGPKQLETTARW